MLKRRKALERLSRELKAVCALRSALTEFFAVMEMFHNVCLASRAELPHKGAISHIRLVNGHLTCGLCDRGSDF